MQATNTVPRLFLHFDINKTLVLKDTSKGMDDEAMIISLLAEFTKGVWGAPYDAMSYKEYVCKVVVPDNPCDTGVKAKQQQQIGQFIEMLKATNHPLCDEVLNRQQQIRQKLPSSVFHSFYKLVGELRKVNMQFVILLRTFGNDLQEVIDVLEAHPEGIKVPRRAAFKNGALHEGAKIVEKTEKIFETFLQTAEHFAIQDCWSEWNSDGQRARSGKPFHFDALGSHREISNLSLFFDDNFTGEEKDIIRPVEIAGQQISGSELKGKMVFTVNPIAAILDDDYYVNLVKDALIKNGFSPSL